MNTLHNSGERSGDEPKQPPTTPISPVSSSPEGSASPARHQHEGASKLSDHTITPPKEDHEILEVERRVHDIAQRLIEYLDIQGISKSSYPKVERVSDKLEDAHYNGATNTIALKAEDFNDGFVIGEEVAHWLHDQCQSKRPQVRKDGPRLTADQRSNSNEFVGYLGRELVRRACADSEVQYLFDPQSIWAPMKSTDLRGKIAADEQELIKREIWNKEYYEKTLPLVHNSLDAVLNAESKCAEVYCSPESLNYTSLREMILTQKREILLPIDQAVGSVLSCSDAEELRDLPRVKTLDCVRHGLDSISSILLDRLAEREKSAEEDVGERCDSYPTYAWKIFDFWDGTLPLIFSALHDLILNEPNPRLIIAAQLSYATHTRGYEAAAVWLERTKDIQKSGARLFHLFPEELHATYVLPLNMEPLPRVIYMVKQSARYLLNGLFGSARREG